MTQSTHRLSIERIEQAARIIDPVFLHSPQFVCEPLSDELGTRLALKIETLNPIRSFNTPTQTRKGAGTGIQPVIQGFLSQVMAAARTARLTEPSD